MIPNLDNAFDRNLLNTFLCYIDHEKFFPFKLKLNTDDRGSFVETVKLNSGGQVCFSTTVPGITRGNHYHTRKAERFAVIKGKARIEFAESEQIKCYPLNWMERNHLSSICPFGTPTTSPTSAMKNYTPSSGSTNILIPKIPIPISKKFKNIHSVTQCSTPCNTVKLKSWHEEIKSNDRRRYPPRNHPPLAGNGQP